MKVEDAIERIQLIECEPGDVFVLTVPFRLSPEQVDVLQGAFTSLFAGTQCIVLQDGIRLDGVLSNAKADEGTA